MTTPAPQNPTVAATPAPGAAGAGNHPSGSLYVGDLAPDVTEALLFEIFNPVGPVSSIRVCRDSNTRRSLGYAYVNFHNAADAERALDTLNFFAIKNRPCRIMWSHRDPSVRKNTNSNIFIKNLDKTIDNKELYDTFSQFGNILSCKVATDSTGNSKGHGYVHYVDENDAAKAIDAVNGNFLKDKRVYAGKFERRQDRQNAGVTASRFTNIYIKLIPSEWTHEKFSTTFGQYGKITSLYLPVNEEGKHRGFGCINYESHEEAARAVDEGRKIPIGEDKTLFVDRFQKKAERQSVLSKRFEDIKREKSEKYKNLNLFVKNLDDDVNEAKLKELFESFGEISSSVIMRDEKGTSKGFGFVCFANADDATRALTEMNSKMIGSKPVYVNRAQRKEERRAQLEGQFQQSMNQRMQMPVFYAPPSMGMTPQLMYQPAMMGRNRYAGPGAPVRGSFNSAPFPGAQQARSRGPSGPQRVSIPPNQGRAGGQKGYRQGPNPRYPPRDMMQGHPMAHVQAQMPVHMHGDGELTSHALASAAPEMQKQMLGERLFPRVQTLQPELAGKITGMLLEMEVTDILNLIDNQNDLNGKVREAVEVLQSHAVPEQK